jgi:hypothetical protein
VSLTIQNVVDYKLPSTVGQINSLVSNVRNDSQVLDDFLLSWVHSYRSSIAYNDSSDAVFIGGLQGFLATTSGNVFINDVVIDTTSNSITASRLHILTRYQRIDLTNSRWKFVINHILNSQGHSQALTKTSLISIIEIIVIRIGPNKISYV